MSVRVELLVFKDCPHADDAQALVQRVVTRLAPGANIERVEVETPEKAAQVGFLGSPSIRVNHVDIEGKRTSTGALSCRTYEGGSGVPPEWVVEAAVLRALQPRGILFLCVANSARSQIAEGVARALAPADMQIWSAGSRPTSVRPEAITVLKEIGIDISHHRSKAVAEIPAAEVDTVITLCGEEECPLFLGKARRLHWRLPDPAALSGNGERLAAFRMTRDELRRRLKLLLAPADGSTLATQGAHKNPTDRRPAMDKVNEAKPKKTGLLAILRESMTKTSEGCGPGCACHVEEKKKKTKGSEDTKKPG